MENTYNLELYLDKINKAAAFLEAKLPAKPEFAVVLGSGLGDMVDNMENVMYIPYSEVPSFPKSTVVGHKGRFVFGKIAGKYVLAMQGRFHYYEGYEMWDVILPIRVFAKLNIKKLVLTNAAGCVSSEWQLPGLMLLKDQLSIFCPSALRGPNLDDLGPRFNDCTELYSKDWREKVKTALNNPELHEGVYAYLPGPNYESPADIRAMYTLGADAVGMSTVPEAICASHAGMEVCGMSLLTNYAAGIADEALNHSEVVEAGRIIAKQAWLTLEKIIEVNNN